MDNEPKVREPEIMPPVPKNDPEPRRPEIPPDNTPEKKAPTRAQW